MPRPLTRSDGIGESQGWQRNGEYSVQMFLSARLSKLTSLLLLVAACFALTPHVASAATRSNIYSGYSKVGYAERSGKNWNIYSGTSKVGYAQKSGSKWNVFEGYSKVGYAEKSGSKWNVYADYTKVGYLSQSGSKWNVYADYTKVGYVDGSGFAPAGASLLLLLGEA